ncbi:MAG TPA: hypothetical protein PLZ57_01530 [Pseudobdellovibrionaceae bacterium]|nr:hypothetical protein [Pseudobdellovibrionaceae bacterium]
MVVRIFTSSLLASLAFTLFAATSQADPPATPEYAAFSFSDPQLPNPHAALDHTPLGFTDHQLQAFKIPPPQQAPTLAFPFIPDSQSTPGSLCSKRDRDYKQDRYAEKIPYCGRNVASSLKRDIYDDYGISANCRKEYTIDHFIPLAIGGSNRRENLWPEHKSIKALRQNLEMDVYNELRNGAISQAEALQIIVEAKLNPPVKYPRDFEFCQ